MAKDYFTEHGVAYEEINVAVDIEKRKEMVEKSGQLGVPVIEIGDKVVVGFDEEEIAHLLGAQGDITASTEDITASDASSATA